MAWRVLVVLGLLVGCGAPPAPAPVPADHAIRRAVYVRDAAALLADPAGLARLDAMIRERRVTAVVPYGLGVVLALPGGDAALARWFFDLRRRGVGVIAPIAGEARLRELDRFVGAHPDARPTALVTELEFWNRADRGAALDELVALLAAMKARAAGWGPLEVGAYLGYPDVTEVPRIVSLVDFVFLDYSVRSATRAWGHVHPRGGPLRDRFGWFAAAGIAVWPIFYAAGEVDILDELRAHGLAAAERRFSADLAADRELSHHRVGGFVYFTFEALP